MKKVIVIAQWLPSVFASTGVMFLCCVNLSANMFCQFFNDKLSKIAVNIANRLRTCSPPVISLPNPPPLFSFFSPVSASQVDSLLLALSKPSSVDIIHISLLSPVILLFLSFLVGWRIFPLLLVIFQTSVNYRRSHHSLRNHPLILLVFHHIVPFLTQDYWKTSRAFGTATV